MCSGEVEVAIEDESGSDVMEIWVQRDPGEWKLKSSFELNSFFFRECIDHCILRALVVATRQPLCAASAP